MEEGIKTINISPATWVQKARPSVFTALLPYLIVIALIISNLFFAVNSTQSLQYFFAAKAVMSDLIILTAIACGVIEYLIFVLLMFIYRKCLQRVPYYFLVPKQAFITHFRFWYLMRTIVMCGFNLLLFVAPYLNVFSPIVSLILSYLVVVLSYVSLTKYIDIMFRHMYFRLLIAPWFVLQVVILVLWWL